MRQNRSTMSGSVGDRRAIAAAILVAWLNWVGAVVAYEAGSVVNGGSISGSVKFKGAVPTPKLLQVNKDEGVCAKTPKTAQDLIVGSDGGVRNAVISIVGIAKGKPFDAGVPALIDENGCEYAPHVLAVQPGDVEFRNSDGILHNVHTHGDKNAPRVMVQPRFKPSMKAKFEQPEVVKLTCDVHGWMTGYVVVQEHPYYAVTDDSGGFKLADVPDGDYDLKVWHEALGETTQKVSVQPGADTKVTFELAPK